MSSILKALRRLEEERARKSHVAPEIAASLLRGDSRRQKSSLWIWPAVFALVVVTLAVFFWSWRPAVVSNLSNPPASLTLSAPATLPVSSPAGRGGEIIIEEIVDQRQSTLLPVAALPVSTPAHLPDKVKPPIQSREEAVPTPVANNPVPVFITERQSPVVSAIAWQDDSSARMAVVDGLPVMTGESVATARIVEILPDRILFEEGGERFTVRMQSQ